MWRTSVRRSRCCIVDIFGAGRHLESRRGVAASTRPHRGPEATAGRRFEFVPLAGSRSYFFVRIDRPVIRTKKYGLGTARGAKSERPTPKKSERLPTQRECSQAAKPATMKQPRPVADLSRRACATEIDPNACIRGDLRRGREPAPRAPRAVSRLSLSHIHRDKASLLIPYPLLKTRRFSP